MRNWAVSILWTTEMQRMRVACVNVADVVLNPEVG